MSDEDTFKDPVALREAAKKIIGPTTKALTHMVTFKKKYFEVQKKVFF